MNSKIFKILFSLINKKNENIDVIDFSEYLSEKFEVLSFLNLNKNNKMLSNFFFKHTFFSDFY